MAINYTCIKGGEQDNVILCLDMGIKLLKHKEKSRQSR